MLRNSDSREMMTGSQFSDPSNRPLSITGRQFVTATLHSSEHLEARRDTIISSARLSQREATATTRRPAKRRRLVSRSSTRGSCVPLRSITLGSDQLVLTNVTFDNFANDDSDDEVRIDSDPIMDEGPTCISAITTRKIDIKDRARAVPRYKSQSRLSLGSSGRVTYTKAMKFGSDGFTSSELDCRSQTVRSRACARDLAVNRARVSIFRTWNPLSLADGCLPDVEFVMTSQNQLDVCDPLEDYVNVDRLNEQDYIVDAEEAQRTDENKSNKRRRSHSLSSDIIQDIQSRLPIEDEIDDANPDPSESLKGNVGTTNVEQKSDHIPSHGQGEPQQDKALISHFTPQGSFDRVNAEELINNNDNNQQPYRSIVNSHQCKSHCIDPSIYAENDDLPYGNQQQQYQRSSPHDTCSEIPSTSQVGQRTDTPSSTSSTSMSSSILTSQSKPLGDQHKQSLIQRQHVGIKNDTNVGGYENNTKEYALVENNTTCHRRASTLFDRYFGSKEHLQKLRFEREYYVQDDTWNDGIPTSYQIPRHNGS